MSYKHLLLGCLADQPMSGYSLYKHLFSPFRRPLSQIYRTLNKMTEEGLLQVERVVQDKAPNQNVYSLTEAGRDELVRWLREPEPATIEQAEVLSKLWLGGRVDKDDIIKNLESYAKHVERQLEYFKGKIRPLVEARAKERGHSVDDVYQLLTVNFTVRQYEVASEWVGGALKEIMSLEHGDGKVESAGRER